MIHGAHFLLYSTDAAADRAFLARVLELKHVDVGRGWLIFKLPPAEIAVHPADGADGDAGLETMPTQLYLMCRDLDSTLAALAAHGVKHTRADTAPWGRHTLITLPSGGRIGVYQPSHPEAIAL